MLSEAPQPKSQKNNAQGIARTRCRPQKEGALPEKHDYKLEAATGSKVVSKENYLAEPEKLNV
jgi:hypothetical protein